VTTWDLRTLGRALAATTLALVVVWLVTAATDEGQLSTAVRIARVMPIAPLCSAVGAALALGTTRVREEARALEALGRSPATVARPAALGAAFPSLAVAVLLAASPSLDVQAFYPRAPRAETFKWNDGLGAFESDALGVRVGESGEAVVVAPPRPGGDEDGVPAKGRAAAAAATALAGAALALLASRTVLAPALSDDARARTRRFGALALGVTCALGTLVAFQAAAARAAPAEAAVLAPALLLGAVLLGYRDRHELASRR
jgi:hypothetical protein